MHNYFHVHYIQYRKRLSRGRNGSSALGLAKCIYYLIFGVPLLRSINGQSLKKNIALAPISEEWP